MAAEGKEKKRKAAGAVAADAPQSKKTKKGPSTINVHADKIKKLLGQKDELPKLDKKSKMSASVPAVGLSADGVNGVTSNAIDASLEASTKDAASAFVQAEAQRTTENGVENEYESDEDIDQAGALLKGFDSDSEDPAEDEGFDKDKLTAALPNYKKTQKKLRQAAQKGTQDGPGAVYVGRIPHGFYENEMRQYFSQFGTITKLRLSRNRKTGHSKHFAFLEFESNEVAKIVAETMDNYLMYGHIVKCKYVQPEALHPDTFKGANKRFRVAPHNRIEKRALEAPKSESQWAKKNSKEQSRREKKAEKLKAMGYEIELPKLRDPSEVLQKKSDSASEEKGPDSPMAEKSEIPGGAATAEADAAPSNKKPKREKKEKKKPHSTIAEKSDLLGGTTTTDANTAPNNKKSKEKKEKMKPASTVAEKSDLLGGTTAADADAAPNNKKSRKEKKEKKKRKEGAAEANIRQ